MTARRDWSAEVELVASDLEGTCQSLEQVLERYDIEGADNDPSFCAALDARVFCCTVCDWWHDVGESGNDVNGQWACVECGTEDRLTDENGEWIEDV